MSTSEDIMSIPEGKGDNENLRQHLENIKFMKAYYGHCKAYVECHPSDKGAFQIDGGKWITEVNIKHGSDWEVRRAKLSVLEYVRLHRNGDLIIKDLNKFLFPPKTKWISALDLDSYNYLPKEISDDLFGEAEKEGLILHNTQEDAQKECDKINSL